MQKKSASETSRKQKPQGRTDFKKSISTEQDFSPVRNLPWETDLLNVFGKKISLSHPPLKSGSVTMEYGLSPSIIPIQEGITIKPGRAFGQVAAYDDKITGSTSIIFNAAGGEVDFASPNLKGVKSKGELAVANFVAERSPEAVSSAEEQPVIDSIALPPLYSYDSEILSPDDEPKTEQSPAAPVEADVLSAAQTPDTNDTTEISISLSEPMVIEPMDDFRIELGSAEYIKHKNESEPKLKFHQTKLTYKNQSVAQEFETESDRFGLHTKDEFRVPLDVDTLAESGFEKAQGKNIEANLLLNSDGATIDTFSRDDLVSVKEPLDSTKDKRTAPKITGDIFTDDGFLQLEDAQFDFTNDGDSSVSVRGTGSFRFLKIPYDITIPGKKDVGSASHLKGVTQEKREHENEIGFTIGNDGKINAEFDDVVQLPMLKGRNESESVIKTLTLNNAAIRDSVLTTESVRIDRGFNLEQDIEENAESETAKKLFGMGLSGTIADVGGSVKLSRDDGIIGETEKKQLGQFAVSDFLGFLDVSGDYAAGTLHAGLHAGAEKSRDKTQKLAGESKNLSNSGISIPIAGPLSFEFSAGTSFEIGGELSADLARVPQQSFGEEMKPDETMALGGSLNISGSASVNLSAGVAAGVSALVTNLLATDIKLNANLGADFDTELTGGTALGKENGKLRQADDLSIKGTLDITLSGALSLSSDIKFLIWKANIFTIELGKKEIKLAQASGTVTRDAGVEGIKNGWHFESLDLSAEAFGKKAGLALKNQKPAKPEPIAVTRDAAEVIGKEALGAWAVLEDLKRQQSFNNDRAYFIDKAEQTALNDKIHTMTSAVKEKLKKYVSALTEYEKRLVQEEEAAAEAVKTARDEQNKYQHKDEIRQAAMRQAEIGGFNLENYRQEREQELLSEKKEPENALSKEEKAKIREENKSIRAENKLREQNNNIVRAKNKMLRQMASADFAIARQVGIYNDAMTMAKDSYDTFAQAENMKLAAKSKDIPQENLYQMSSKMSDSDFLYKDHAFWGNGADELKRLTSFGGKGDSYFKSLYTNAINSARGREREGFGIYRKVFRAHSDPGSAEKSQIRNMSGYDLLKIILTDRYPNGACDSDGNDRSGKVIGAAPNDKLKALKYLFNENSAESLIDAFTGKVLGFEKEKTKQQAMLDDSDRIYQAIFDTTMQNMTAKGNVDIDEKLLELNKKLEESKEKYLQTVQEHLDTQAALVKVRAQQEDCRIKLDSLKKNAAAGIMLQENSVAGAVAAVDFMEKDFSDINSGKRLMEAVSDYKGPQEVLKQAGAIS